MIYFFVSLFFPPATWIVGGNFTMGVTYSRINPRERGVGCPFHWAVPSFSTRALCLVGPANYHVVKVKKVRNLGIFYLNLRKILIIKKKKKFGDNESDVGFY